MIKLQLQGVILIITAMLSAVLLSACGKNPEDKELIPEQGTKQEAEAETKTEAEAETKTEAEAETKTEAVGSADEDWDDFCGNWMLVGFEYSDSIDDTEPSVDHSYYYAEHEWIFFRDPHIRRRKQSICGLQPHWIRNRIDKWNGSCKTGSYFGWSACSKVKKPA